MSNCLFVQMSPILDHMLWMIAFVCKYSAILYLGIVLEICINKYACL